MICATSEQIEKLAELLKASGMDLETAKVVAVATREQEATKRMINWLIENPNKTPKEICKAAYQIGVKPRALKTYGSILLSQSVENNDVTIISAPTGYGKTVLLKEYKEEKAENAEYFKISTIVELIVRFQREKTNLDKIYTLFHSKVIIIDEIEELIGKKATTEEIKHIIYSLIKDKRKIVLSTANPKMENIVKGNVIKLDKILDEEEEDGGN